MNHIGDIRLQVFEMEGQNQNKAKVIINVDNLVGGNFKVWMCACEYLLHKTAQKSNAGYEKALDLLRKGAMTYRDIEL